MLPVLAQLLRSERWNIMANISRQLDKLFFKLTGTEASDLICLGARIRDQLSTIPEMRMEFFSTSSDFNPTKVLGTRLTLEGENGFKFSGVCISIEDLGHQDEIDLFAAEIRPWPWLLSIGSDNRVFQNLTTPQIIEEVFSSQPFATAFINKTKQKFEKREYCVQFGESNLDFISRLMEEDGIYYYFDHSGSVEQMVLADGVSAHTNKGTVSFSASNSVGKRQANSDSIFEWAELGRVVTGKVMLFDYDMIKPTVDLKAQVAAPAGTNKEQEIEHYKASGHYSTDVSGERYAKVELEGYKAASQRSRGLTNSSRVLVGGIFKLDHPQRKAANEDYLVTHATHYMYFDPGFVSENKQTMNRNAERIEYPEEMGLFESEFEVQKSAVQFRPPKMTPWPQVPSLLTAKVTGPGGDEIHTDAYGRIKVIFPWDRKGKPDEHSSMFVRSVMPWGGNGWGMFSIPRIGMEVIIQFERGNIDRPYCTGVVYNAANKPPYPIPGGETKTGIRTNSSKGGGGFHELTFDDKKGEELVFFQSEKNYTQIVKDDAVITIGSATGKGSSLTQTVQKNKTETIKEGNLTETVEKGNKTEKVSMGNSTIEVSMGNLETLVKMGNVKLDASMGKITITAMQEIELKVGANSIKIGPAGVTVTGTMVTLDGKAMTEVKGPIVMVKGTAMTQISGGVVMVG
jgi:type VI secretion system secreted protein VgrG